MDWKTFISSLNYWKQILTIWTVWKLFFRGTKKFPHSVEKAPGLGTLPYINFIGMCRPKGYGFWAVLVWKRVYILTILVLNWVSLSRKPQERINAGICVYNSKINNKDRELTKIYPSSWIWPILDFCRHGREAYYATTKPVGKFVTATSGLKTGMFLVWNGVRN